jgi:uncharacterized membrane protein YfcA
MTRFLLLIVLLLFVALSSVALYQHGYWGIVLPHFKGSAGAQVFADLVIALSLSMVWIFHDARTAKRNPWPWLITTVTLGSIGPLVYLLTKSKIRESST